MSKKDTRVKRNTNEISISFLDVISCGFGAIVLLLLIAKSVDSSFFQTKKHLILSNISATQSRLFEIRGEINVLQESLRSKENQLMQVRKAVANLEKDLMKRQKNNSIFFDEKNQLELAQQSLTDVMRRLSKSQKKSNENIIGGIPVDSEYIVFIIDTSGSMSNFAWTRVKKEMINILNIYPKVKGIQVMNDMGDYMFSSFSKKWIPDTPARRKAILNRLTNWAPFSNSSPVEGIQKAIRQFYSSKKKISLYVFGDDFTGGSIGQVLKVTDKINKADGVERLVRIHTIGFPVHFQVEGGNLKTATRFSALMRELSYDNNGTFVGLTGLE
ncbi:MAG: hypothetical protein CMK44_06300 [Porticoccus sp.]|jgi:hypothetical protein|nr:hypothetical protein [Porticoccus sp.]|tara:strand:- start:128 stop:1114 length:987 start_codon:yes stop_codon:yes gene_type:complete